MRFKIGDYLRKKTTYNILALKMTSSEWGIPRKRGPEETLKRFSKSS